MKYFILIWAGIWRKKIRTIFTMLSVVVAFLLFGLLQGFNLGMDSMIGNLNASRLYTANKYSMVEGLPVALAQQIATVEGVNTVSHLTYFGGFYQDAKQPVPVFASDVTKFFSMYSEITLDPALLRAMEQTRNGALVGKPVMERYGWQVGDVVPIGTSIWTNKSGSNDYRFEIIGELVADDPAAMGVASSFYINYDYFDEARQFGNGNVHYFFTHIDDPQRGGEVSAEIDGLFANSNNETNTQTEQAFAASQIKQVADIGFIVNAIVGAVLFTLLFLTGNTMMQSMRERIPELAILKTLGFTDTQVSAFVMCESIVLCVVSALLGLLAAGVVFTFLTDILGPISLPLSVVVWGALAAIVLAVISGAPPAWRTQRLSIVDALAGR